MLFNSMEFLCFLCITFTLYRAIRDHRRQNVFLLVAGYVFYGWWDWRFCGLLALVSASAFATGLIIEQWPQKRKWALGANVAVNLAVLLTFKYFDFFAESAAELLRLIGFNPDCPTLHLILPVGISFYTFQAISYTIDIARGDIRPTHNAVHFFAYISFFPQLVAGPIERASNLLPQFGRERKFDGSVATDGLRQMLWGLFKKMVVADNCAVAVNAIWARLDSATAPEAAIAAVLFAMQIYADFSGYSDIALGCAKLFGFNLSINFRYPYFAVNIADFWRRWHISLTSWLRDYVYIPLGGNRQGQAKTFRNILFVWALSGLWHGAAWTFVAWGLWHGTLIVIWRLAGRDNRGGLAAMCFTFLLVCLGWILFRAESLTQAMTFFRTLTRWDSLHVTLPTQTLALPIAAGILMLAAEWMARTRDHALQFSPNSILSRHGSLRMACYVVLAMLICVYAGTQSQFIYFRF